MQLVFDLRRSRRNRPRKFRPDRAQAQDGLEHKEAKKNKASSRSRRMAQRGVNGRERTSSSTSSSSSISSSTSITSSRIFSISCQETSKACMQASKNIALPLMPVSAAHALYRLRITTITPPPPLPPAPPTTAAAVRHRIRWRGSATDLLLLLGLGAVADKVSVFQFLLFVDQGAHESLLLRLKKGTRSHMTTKTKVHRH